VEGIVIDGETGMPIPRYSIAARPVANSTVARFTGATTVSEESGSFKLIGIGEDAEILGTRREQDRRWNLVVEAPGYAPQVFGPLVLLASQDQRGLRISMTRGSTIHGHLTDESGQGVEDANVALLEVLPPLERRSDEYVYRELQGPKARVLWKQSRRSLADGSFVIPNVGAGQYRIRVDHPRMVTHDSEIVSMVGSADLNLGSIRLHSGLILKGVVLDSLGKPDPTAIVLISSPENEESIPHTQGVDGEGEFELGRLRPGLYRACVIQRRGQALGPGVATPVDVHLKPNHVPYLTLKEGFH
jgi:hypothetical protein